MKRQFAVWLVLNLYLVGCTGGKQAPLKSKEDKLSYVIGQQIGNGLKSQNLKVDADILAKSIKDVLKGEASKLTPQEMQEVMMAVQNEQMEKQQGEAKDNQDKGAKYLAANKAKPGVKVTPSGLQYQILTAGKGPVPKVTDTVKVHYKGTLTDGTEFDSSIKRGQPAEFPVTGVIKGWTEALQLMKVGSKWQLTIPSEIAYGPQGRPSIPANSVLVFEVELLEIVAAKKKS